MILNSPFLYLMVSRTLIDSNPLRLRNSPPPILLMRPYYHYAGYGGVNNIIDGLDMKKMLMMRKKTFKCITLEFLSSLEVTWEHRLACSTGVEAKAILG